MGDADPPFSPPRIFGLDHDGGQNRAWLQGRSRRAHPDLGCPALLAGSSRAVTSLAKPERKGVYGCGREAEALRRGPCSSGSQRPGERLTGVFHSLTLPWLPQAPGLGHPTHEALLQGRFARRFNDQSSSCAQNRGYFLVFLFSFKHLAGAGVSCLFDYISYSEARAACSFQAAPVSVHLRW